MLSKQNISTKARLYRTSEPSAAPAKSRGIAFTSSSDAAHQRIDTRWRREGSSREAELEHEMLLEARATSK